MNPEFELCGVILNIKNLGNQLTFSNDWSFKIKCFHTQKIVTVLCHYY